MSDRRSGSADPDGTVGRDILTRLRRNPTAWQLCDDAIAEIERLRAHVTDLEQQLRHYEGEAARRA
jgi:hypothetical protein